MNKEEALKELKTVEQFLKGRRLSRTEMVRQLDGTVKREWLPTSDAKVLTKVSAVIKFLEEEK